MSIQTATTRRDIDPKVTALLLVQLLGLLLVAPYSVAYFYVWKKNKQKQETSKSLPVVACLNMFLFSYVWYLGVKSAFSTDVAFYGVAAAVAFFFLGFIVRMFRNGLDNS